MTIRPNGPTLFSTQDFKNWKRLTWICEPVCVWLKNQKTFGSRSLNFLLNKQILCKSTGLLVQSSSVFSQIFKVVQISDNDTMCTRRRHQVSTLAFFIGYQRHSHVDGVKANLETFQFIINFPHLIKKKVTTWAGLFFDVVVDSG